MTTVRQKGAVDVGVIQKASGEGSMRDGCTLEEDSDGQSGRVTVCQRESTAQISTSEGGKRVSLVHSEESSLTAWAREGKKAEESYTEESQGTDVEGFAFNLAGSEDPLKTVHKSMT